MSASALFHTAPGRVVWREVTLPPLGAGQVRVEAVYSAISPGTESLVFQGRVPRDMTLDATLDNLPGTFEYPFSYGYALVGRIVEHGGGVSDDCLGRRVFLFHPHQDQVVAPLGQCLMIPEDIPYRAALFAPNMESALSFVMDAAPLVGERVLVFGQGVVGLLTTAVLARFPLGRLTGADMLAPRRERSLDWGAMEVVDPADAGAWEALHRALFSGDGRGADLCFELSGSLEALNQAIAMTGFAGRILLGSWYGAADRPVNLGGPFHRRRISLISSQVSTLSPGLTGRWDKVRRMTLVWDWLRRLSPETLITHEFRPDECQQAFELCSHREDSVLQTVFRYSTD